MKKHWPLIIFLVFYFSIIVFKLISYPAPFYDWDEAIYAQVGREAITNKSLFLTLQGSPWLEKPPLAPVLYGVISSLSMSPEISTRLASLILSLIALILIYYFVLRICKNEQISFLTVVITATNTLFIQRAQIINTDVLLLIGWLGYFLFYEKYWISLFFLFVGFFSKSLLGIYPAGLMVMFHFYKYLRKEVSLKDFIYQSLKRLSQILILISWYFLMFFRYGNEFIQVHFIDHLFKRVTKSIESHFGARTYYFDLIIKEYGYGLFLNLLSIILLLKTYLKQKISSNKFLLSFCLFPWFIFLNLTKTKIEWYLYPTIPQFAFLLSYPISVIKNKLFSLIIVITLTILLIYKLIIIDGFFSKYYSTYNEIYKMSILASKECKSLKVTASKNERKDHDVLTQLNLLISTSEVNGNHPSIIYYFNKPVKYIYSIKQINNEIALIQQKSCITLYKEDLSLININTLYNIGMFGDLYLYKKH